MSPIEIGRIKQYLIGKETSFGTKASTFFALPRAEGNLNPRSEFAKDESGIGQIENVTKSRIMHKWTEPSLSMIAGDKSFGLLMLAAMGTDTPSADTPEAGVNTHDFTVLNTNAHPSFTIIEIDGVEVKMATGCRLNSMEITSEEDFLRVSASFMGLFEETTTQVPSFVEENCFLPKHRTFKTAADIASLGGASAITIESMRMTIEKNTEIFWGGSEEPSQIVNKQFSVTGDVTLAWEAATYKDFQFGDTKQALLLQFENTDVTIGAVTNPLLSFTFAQANLEDWGKDDGNDDFVMQTIAFVPEYKISEGLMASAQAINTQVSY